MVVECGGSGGRKVAVTDVRVCAIVAEEMTETYDAAETARSMSVTVVQGLVTRLDRAESIQCLNLDLDWSLVTDIRGIHPPSLTGPHTLKIRVDD